MDIEMYIFVCAAGFLASFVDAAVGGGGMISLPALMMTGISPLHVLGTNKMSAVMGAFASFVTFVKSGKMDIQLVKKLFPLSVQLLAYIQFSRFLQPFCVP